MKIEKLNDNQIRCTLTHVPIWLHARLQLSELAYGTEKAKSLFHDMMQQAAFEFGFEAEDIPLMIEAIPASADSIVLIITKVEGSEELDTRFQNSLRHRMATGILRRRMPRQKLEGAETLLDLLGKVKEKMLGTAETAETVNEEQSSKAPRPPCGCSHLQQWIMC